MNYHVQSFYCNQILFFDSSASDVRDACNARDMPLYVAYNVAQPIRRGLLTSIDYKKLNSFHCPRCIHI